MDDDAARRSPRVQRLIDKVGRFVRPHNLRRRLCHQASSSTVDAVDTRVATMADKDDDFSSLPLPDRFTQDRKSVV